MENKLYEKLKQLNIAYEIQEHEAVYTIEEILNLNVRLDGIGLKNLFVKDKFDNRYLIIVEENKRTDLKKLKEELNLNKLSFCKEEDLMESLSITPGAVTPLAVINNNDKSVTVIVDEDIRNNHILVHPLVNTKTLRINFNDLIKLFNDLNTTYIIIKIPLKDAL